MMRIAINGLGRIGKTFLRILVSDKHALQKITIAAINIGPAKKELLEHFIKYDSIMGSFNGTVQFADDQLHINDLLIPIFTTMNALKLPWKKLAIDWVVDCSGKYTDRVKAEEHLKAGAPAVLLSAPSHNEDVMIIPGVNDAAFDKKCHKIVSLGSCTTNALIPVLKVLHEYFILEHAFMTTVHAYTNSQVLLDVMAHDERRSRAAAINIIPTTSGATNSVAKVLPQLADKFDGVSLRVPVDKVSLLDVVFRSAKKASVVEINDLFKEVSQGSLKGIVRYCDEQLVSSDFKGDPSSVIFDATLTKMQGSMGKVFGWYDNEWGYSQRLKDFLLHIVS